MQIRAATVDDYLAALPDDRRRSVEVLRATIRKHLGKGFEEGMQYGAIGYYVPHALYPSGYHCDPKQPLPFAGIGVQKHHIGLYFFCIYISPELQERFVEGWKASGKRLDMGKSCVRVKSSDDVPLDVLGAVFESVSVDDFVAYYEASRAKPSGTRAKKGVKKATPRKASTKKSSRKQSS